MVLDSLIFEPQPANLFNIQENREETIRGGNLRISKQQTKVTTPSFRVIVWFSDPLLVSQVTN